MSNDSNKNKKLTLVSLILMIFTSVFGFTNMPRSFYLMGYGAIPWFILSALFFFIPYAFMMAEYGAAFKTEKGGIYSWMAKSVGPKYAFIGTFMWYASYIVWMVNVSNGIWIPLSNAIFGSDETKSWALNLGPIHLGSVQIIGILAILWIIFVSYISSHGLEKIKKITSVGGTAVAALNVVLLIGAVIVLIGNKGQLAQPIDSMRAFIDSPHPDYQSTIGMFAFLVFAIFSFGGIEVVGGLVDETENAEVTFPKGVAISAIVISVGYAIGIFLCGIFTNWSGVLSSSDVHMANVAYVMMQNLGVQVGLAFGATEATSLIIGAWVARFVGLSMFLALTGAFFTLTYAPLKQLIEGTPRELWPGKIGKIDNGMPKFAMKVQAVIVIVMIAVISFGGDGASEFFNKLVLMTNVAMTIPYLFLSIAFISFKKNDNIEKPFEVYKSKSGAIIATVVVSITVLFANVFTIIKPALMDNNWSETIWMIAGPIIFTAIALLLYSRYERNYLNK
ncbi:glutamate/gamma-aminobutyrate family transporter YjeM [Clostridium fallax]|uniref:Amino acid/polyamine/organocation transporter, APC superfamily n=1 Tax=Clostridium fallax TaxID=1533 RepID=A0A1M4TW80_9CLOT|nr:glutamate/gamma-aminobutyrate family transporter YjeM [Clostridium fallax]SHE48683.1 amino acid/polyamine/organocation transporter, APC superfamily [Clostridium fallax]SQB22362.1 amino acid permease [Clostridium fallax]